MFNFIYTRKKNVDNLKLTLNQILTNNTLYIKNYILQVIRKKSKVDSCYITKTSYIKQLIIFQDKQKKK